MSFIHCVKCSWTQDDFYTWPRIYKASFGWTFYMGYNPISRMINSLKELWVPKMIDKYEWTGIKSGQVFSWKMFFFEVARIRRAWKKTVWKTRAKFMKEKEDSCCPGCGAKNWWTED